MKLDFLRVSRDFIAPAPAAFVPLPASRIEVAAPPGVSPNALDAILESLKVMNRRQIRIETRLVLLMKDHGLDSSGRPADML